MSRIIVVGAGQAAAQLAVSLRQLNFAGDILIFGAESFSPYQRPPLSKKFLRERVAPETLYLRSEKYWRDHNVTLHLDAEVRAIDRRRKNITIGDGRHFDYDTLVLATGTRARALPIPGIDLPFALALRSVGDVQKLRPLLDQSDHVTIIGGGYIGLEVASIMRLEGRAVTVVEAEDRVMKRVTSEGVSAFFDNLHRERGVDLKLGARLAALEGEGRVEAVRLASGESWRANLILIATGAAVNQEIAMAAGLPCNDGIIVDASARTADPAIYAIGDCTRFPSARYGRAIRLECVQNAIDQAKAAAAAIMGAPQNYNPVPWFWSDQYEIKFQIAGVLDHYDQAETIGDPSSGRFSVDYRRAGRLIAVDAINDGRAHMLGRRRIAEETASGALSVPSREDVG